MRCFGPAGGYNHSQQANFAVRAASYVWHCSDVKRSRIGCASAIGGLHVAVAAQTYDTWELVMIHVTRKLIIVAAIVATAVCSFCFLMPAWSSLSARVQMQQALAERLLGAMDASAGLCVRLGVADGSLTVALSQEGRYLVHGLSDSHEVVERARETVAAAGLEGVVSVERGDYRRLPYSDNLVNLLVVDDLVGLLDDGLSVDEVLRVLRPGGAAWLGQHRDTDAVPLTVQRLKQLVDQAGVTATEVVRHEGVWAKIVKPRPEGMDQWTHKRYEAAENPVSRDEEAATPSGIRWMAGPIWPTGNRKTSVPGVVASEKRLVYLFEDEVATANGYTPRNSLVARDAYNGLFLWKRGATAETSPLVSVGDRIYAVLDDGGPLVELDADSGEVVRDFPDTKSPRQAAYVDGLLFVDLPAALGCYDAESGRAIWTHPGRPRRFVAGDGYVFVHTDDTRRGEDSVFVCLDLASGKKIWAESTRPWCKGTPNLILYHNGVLLAASRDATHAVSARDGSHLWAHKYPLIGHGGSYTKVLYVDGLVWVHNAGTDEQPGIAWEGLDPFTGEVKRRIPHTITTKHRCYADVATERYFMCGTMDYVDAATGEHRHFAAAKSSCRAAGILPANGLAYTFPHACGCYSMIRGFLALTPTVQPTDDTQNSATRGETTDTGRLERGPAYSEVGDQRAEVGSQQSDIRNGERASSRARNDLSSDLRPLTSEREWPTYRHDPQRTASTSASGPERLAVLWAAESARQPADRWAAEWDLKNGGRLSSPTMAGNLAFVADVDRCVVRAYDAMTGEPRWSYTAGGRVDCPPTIYGPYCLFGARDGWVYCLRLQDGRLVWRFRAAPGGQKIVAHGQLESVWPVYGGVLVYDDLAYFLAGRHGKSDGGLFVYAVEPRTGRLVWENQLDDYRGVPDVLNGADGTIQMGSYQWRAKTGQRVNTERHGLQGGRLGLLNDAWYKRPIALRRNLQLWTVGEGRSGQMLAFTPTATCGFQAAKVNGGNGALSGDSRLFAALDKKGNPAKWSIEMDTETRVQGIVLAGERLYVAGGFIEANGVSHAVRIYAAAEGELLDQYLADGPFVHDCLAVAADRLYISTQRGTLLCLGVK